MEESNKGQIVKSELVKDALKTSLVSNISSIVSLTPLYPFEVMKTRTQIIKDLKNSATKQTYELSQFFNIFKSEGIKGMYRGFSMTVTTVPIANTIYFPIYEFTKNYLRTQDDEKGFLGYQWKDGDLKLYSISVLTAGSVVRVISNPFVVIRTRMQAEIFNNTSDLHFQNKYGNGFASIFKIMNDIVKKEGFSSLYKGFNASMLGLSNPLIFFPAYENLKIYFKNNFEDPKAQTLSQKYLIASTTLGKLLANTLTYPHEVIRSRLQYEKTITDGMKETLITISKGILQKEGLKGFYSGFSLCLAKSVPQSILYFLIYEDLCQKLAINK